MFLLLPYITKGKGKKGKSPTPHGEIWKKTCDSFGLKGDVGTASLDGKLHQDATD